MTIIIKCEHCNANENSLDFEETGITDDGVEYQTYYCNECGEETIILF